MARVSEAAHSALLLASAWAFGASSMPSARYVSILFSVVVTTSFALYKRLYVSRSPLSVASYYTHVLDPATHADVSVTPYTQITRTCPYTCMRKYSPIVHHTRNRSIHSMPAPFNCIHTMVMPQLGCPPRNRVPGLPQLVVTAVGRSLSFRGSH